MELIFSKQINLVSGGYIKTDTEKCDEELCSLMSDLYLDLKRYSDDGFSASTTHSMISPRYEGMAKLWGMSCGKYVTPSLFAAFINLSQSEPSFQQYKEFLDSNCNINRDEL